MNDVSSETSARLTKSAGRRSGQAALDPGSNGTGNDLSARPAQRQRPSGAARALGWFSIGLGLSQILAPRGVAGLIGASDGARSRKLMRALGMRELTAGVGILRHRRPSRWLWARVAGDLMDLALLGTLVRTQRPGRRMRASSALAVVAGVTLLDAWVGRRASRAAAETARQPIRRSITIARGPAEVYRFWRDFQNLPQFMVHLESVETLDRTHSYWRARSVAGKTFEWKAEIVAERENELISWRTMGGSDVEHAGTVRFRPAPGGRGTEIHVEASYDPPAGAFGRMVALAVGQEPSQQIEGDLRRLKAVLEVGETVESDASIHRGMHPARPSVMPKVRKQGGRS